MRQSCFRWLAVTLLLSVCRPSAVVAGGTPDPDEEVLRRANIKTDEATLLAFLRERSGPDASVGHIPQLVRKLGANGFAEREAAARKLVALGAAALPALEEARSAKDAEVAARARACIDRIRKSGAEYWNHPRAVVQLLGRRRPAGTLAVLLEYLPFVQDEGTREEIWHGIDALAVRTGRLEPALLRALQDKEAARRAVAACIVGRRGDEKQRATVKKLLEDRDPEVRLRAAQGLLAAEDRGALLALVNLLKDPSTATGWQAEELLRWAAGASAPAEVFGLGAEAERRKCVRAWERWWKNQGQSVNLARVKETPRRPGLVMLCGVTPREPAKGVKPEPLRIWLCGCDGLPRCDVKAPAGVTWAHWLASGRLYSFQQTKKEAYRAVEWEVRGKVLWQSRKEYPYTANLERLSAGGLLSLTSSGACGLSDREEKLREVAWEGHPYGSRPYFWQVGEVGHCFGTWERTRTPVADWFIGENDPMTGKLLHRIRLRRDFERDWFVPRMERLEDGRYLLVARVQVEQPPLVVGRARFKRWKISIRLRTIERDGRVSKDLALWEVEWSHGGAGPRGHLRNGNALLVVSDESENRVAEVDPEGRIVWEGLEARPEGRVHDLAMAGVVYPLVRFGFDRSGMRGGGLDTPAHRLALLKSRTVALRRQAASMLRRFRLTEEITDAAVVALDDEDAAVRGYALDIIYQVGPRARKGIPGLVRLLGDADEQKQHRAAWTLVTMGPDCLPRVLASFRDRSGSRASSRRAATLLILPYFLATEKERVIGDLRAALKDEDVVVRKRAIEQLCRQPKSATDLLPDIVGGLNDPKDEIVAQTADGLSKLGIVTKPIVGGLLEAVKRPPARASALSALSVLGWKNPDLRKHPGVKEALLRHAGAMESRDVRNVAVGGLALFDCKEPAVFRAVVDALGDDRRWHSITGSQVSLTAMRSLKSWGIRAKSAAPALLAIVKDKNRYQEVRSAAMETLRAIDQAAYREAGSIMAKELPGGEPKTGSRDK